MSKETQEQIDADKATGENMQWVYKPGEGKIVHASEVAAALKDGWVDTPVAVKEVKKPEADKKPAK